MLVKLAYFLYLSFTIKNRSEALNFTHYQNLGIYVGKKFPLCRSMYQDHLVSSISQIVMSG